MVAQNENQNRDIKDYLIRILRLNPQYDNIPSLVIPSIQPVIEVDKPEIIYRDLATSGNIYVTPSNKDFFLTTVAMSALPATGEGKSSNTIVVTDSTGATRTFYCSYVADTALAASSPNVVFNLPSVGLKLQRGSNIVLGVQSDAGTGAIIGYVSDGVPYP